MIHAGAVQGKNGKNATIPRLQLEKIILEGISLEFNKSLSPKEKKYRSTNKNN